MLSIFLLLTTVAVAAPLMGAAYAIGRWSYSPQLHSIRRDLVKTALWVVVAGMAMSIALEWAMR